MECVSTGAITHFPTAGSGFGCEVSNLLRTAGIPHVVGRSPKTEFSSITITARKVMPSHATSHDATLPGSPLPKLHEAFGGGVSSLPTSTVSVPNQVSPAGVCRQNPTIVMPHEFRHAYSPADGLVLRDHGRSKVQLGQCGLSDRKQDMIGRSVMNLSSYKSCIHIEIPLRSTISFVFLDKSLSISLVDLEGRRADQPALYRSALFVHLGVSFIHGHSIDTKPKKTNKGYRTPRAAMFVPNRSNGQDNDLGHCRRPPPKHKGCEVELIRPTCGTNGKVDDSGTQRHSDTLGFLSFRGPSLSITMAGRQNGNGDEAACLTWSNIRHGQPISGPVDSRACGKQAGSVATEERQCDCTADPGDVSTSDETCSRLKADSLGGTSKILSLKEALELLRPGFISQSQGRVRRLEQMALKRRALRDSNPDLVLGLRGHRDRIQRNCTTPDPLSDNLFKPRERSISGKEMQLRSRRIYNKLPEVTKKMEEEKKRAVRQTNRLRAERLLDQILQR